MAGPCVCTALRRASRIVTAKYDAQLRTAGLTTTQYSLLVRIGRSKQPLTHNELAARMDMDRTTLTRTLAPLLRKQWVEAVKGEDRRERLIRLTEEGRKTATSAYASWEAAQTATVEILSEKKWNKLRKLLRRFGEEDTQTTLSG